VSKFEVVSRLSAEDLAKWRKGRETVAAEGTTAPRMQPMVVKPSTVKPLSAGETADAVKGFLWDNMTKDRDSYAAALRWMRRRVPGLAYKTDRELLDYLDKRARESTQQVLGDRGLLRPVGNITG